MATDPYWQLEKEYTTITDSHDLTLKAIAYTEVTRTENDKTITESKPSKVHEFRVNRAVLCAASPVWGKLLAAGFGEPEQTTVELHDDPTKALETWLHVIHAEDASAAALEGAKFGYRDVELKGLWEMLSVAHKYEIDTKEAKAKGWFENWYNAQAHKEGAKRFGYIEFQALVLPCHAFDYATGFAFVTKQLVYRANGQITERQPRDFQQDNLHIDPLMIQQLNAAKSRLKTILHRDLYNPIDALLKRAPCACKPHVLFAWEQALAATGVWPLETSFAKSSVNDILRQLETNFRAAYQPQGCGLPFCSFSFSEVVRVAVEKTRGYFDGLCLDCISTSHPKLSDHDEDYWHHADLQVPWDQGCRVRHKQPSWYFSFMGRRQKMVTWTRGQRGGAGGRRGGGHQGRGGRGGVVENDE